MADDLKVFISWSGTLSKAVATELMGLLRMASDRITPFMSDLSIESGTRGLKVIADELKATSVGILVVTRDNWQSPWLNFEAGALSKEVEDSETRVIPLLVDLEGTDMASTPIVQFQYRALDEANIERLLKELAALAGADPETTAERVMPRWAEYEERIKAAVTQSHAAKGEPSGPSDSSLLREILETVREIQRTQPPARPVVSLEKSPELVEAQGRTRRLRGLAKAMGYRGLISVKQKGGTWYITHDLPLEDGMRAEILRMWGSEPVKFQRLVGPGRTQPEAAAN